MSPKDRRTAIFRSGKPLVRELKIMDGDEYSKDVGVLWVAYKAGSFSMLPPDLTQEAFLSFIENLQTQFQTLWVIDDVNRAFPTSGKGPVMLVGTSTASLLVKAEASALAWANKRNLIRCAAAFLQMIRHSKKTGVCMVSAKKSDRSFLFHMRKYDLLHYIGRVAENEYLFSVRGIGSD